VTSFVAVTRIIHPRCQHACNVLFNHSNDPKWKCAFLNMKGLQELSKHSLELNGFIPNDEIEKMEVHVKEAANNYVLDSLPNQSHHEDASQCN